MSQHFIISPLLAKQGFVHGFSTRTVGLLPKQGSISDPTNAKLDTDQDGSESLVSGAPFPQPGAPSPSPSPKFGGGEQKRVSGLPQRVGEVGGGLGHMTWQLPSPEFGQFPESLPVAQTGLGRLKHLAGMADGRWVMVRQVHGAGVIRVSDPNGSARETNGSTCDELRCLEDLPEGDALITNLPGVLLAIRTADCVPILIGGPGVVAAVHAGWRGTVARVVVEAIRALESDYNVPARVLFAAIGPSIGPECYEVGQEVVDGLNDVLSAAPGGTDGVVYSADRAGADGGLAANGFDPTRANSKYRVDLKEANRRLLLEAGLRPEAVEVLDLCTACNPELFFSYRREKGTPGRMVNFIGIADSRKGA